MKNKTFEKNSNLKILIIRLSSMGDVVLTTKLIRVIKLNYPNSDIMFVSNREYEDIYKYNIRINTLGLYIRDDIALISKLRYEIVEYSPDLVIDLQNNKRSRYLIEGLDNIVTMDKRRLYKLLLVYTKYVIKRKNLLIPELYINTMRDEFAEIEVDNDGLEFWLERDSQANRYLPFDKQLVNKNSLKIAVAPGAHYQTKRWPKEYFVELINMMRLKYGFEFILLGGKSEYELCDEIANRTQSNNYAGKTNIAESAELLDSCDLIICNDTGLMHIAAARQVPIAVFFGSSVQELGFIPYKVANIIIELDMWCRPCSHIGRRSCPLIHFNCMKKITPNIAFDKIIEFVNYLYKIS